MWPCPRWEQLGKGIRHPLLAHFQRRWQMCDDVIVLERDGTEIVPKSGLQTNHRAPEG